MILNNKTKRIIVYIVGLFILALGLTLNTKASLGVSPIISVLYSISQITGLNFGDLTFIEYVVFVFIQIWIHISENNKKRILSDLLQLPLSLIFAHAILGIGIGTVIAVLGVGRVIALFHHVFESQIIELVQGEKEL